MSSQEEGGAVVLEDSGVLRIPLDIKFDGTPGLNAAVVGESLQALASIVRKSAPVFQKILGVNQEEKFRCTLGVKKIEPGSLAETLFVDIPFGSKELAHQKFQEIVSMLPISPVAATVAIVGVAVVVYALVACRKSRGGDNIQPMIEAHDSIVIASAKKLNIGDEALRGMFTGMKGKNGLAKDAVLALQPGLSAGGGDVRIGKGAETIVIPRRACETLPNPDEMDGGDEMREMPFEGLELTIVASDRDHAKTGWAGCLPPTHAYGGIRLKMELSDGINPATLMYRESARCDGNLVVAVREEDNSFRPRKIVVTCLAEENEERRPEGAGE